MGTVQSIGIMQAEPTISGFRRLLERGYAAVRSEAHARRMEAQFETSLREYRIIFGILNAMTAAERASPQKSIDADRIRRIARGAGARDQDVIQVLFSFREYCEQVLRDNWLRGRDSA
jgi:signal recognition particle GTPase